MRQRSGYVCGCNQKDPAGSTHAPVPPASRAHPTARAHGLCAHNERTKLGKLERLWDGLEGSLGLPSHLVPKEKALRVGAAGLKTKNWIVRGRIPSKRLHFLVLTKRMSSRSRAIHFAKLGEDGFGSPNEKDARMTDLILFSQGWSLRPIVDGR